MKLRIMTIFVLGFSSLAYGQDRDTKVRNDRKAFQDSKTWIYNNLEEGIRVAKAKDQPMLIVFRCIPCEACHEFDDDVARRDPIIRDLLDQYVCVRIVQANAIDLTKFQYDFDQSFAVILTNPDMTIYGRFGTRSDREETEDISLQGLRKALLEGLRMHSAFAMIKPSLAGKQVKQAEYKTPRDYPTLSGKYRATLNYEGQVTKSCIHCHQIREAERLVYRENDKAIPDSVLYPYPDPAVLGLKMDPAEMTKIERVVPGSIAERAGLKVGDEIVSLVDQPLLSTADLQWVLHNAPAHGRLNAQIRRSQEKLAITLELPDNWRKSDISWRVTTWDLRRMALGGMRLEPLSKVELNEAKLPQNRLALKVRHLGDSGSHGVAKKAGIARGDIIIAFDGLDKPLSESELIAHAVQNRRKGDQIELTFLRNAKRQTVKFPLQ